MHKAILFFLFLYVFTSCHDGRFAPFPKSVEDSPASILRAENPRILEGNVIKIADGDSFTLLLNNGQKERVRLFGIDCPERMQPFSNVAKQTLSGMIFNKKITVYYQDKDRYDRVLGEVVIDGRHVNQEMVQQGMAWHYKKYSDSELLSNFEAEARKLNLGLWADSNPIPPWKFRQQKRNAKK